jgi:hypothetical protein
MKKDTVYIQQVFNGWSDETWTIHVPKTIKHNYMIHSHTEHHNCLGEFDGKEPVLLLSNELCRGQHKELPPRLEQSLCEVIALTDKQAAFSIYSFIKSDLCEGVTYPVSRELYNKAMRPFGINTKNDTAPAVKLEKDFRSEWNKLTESERAEFLA